MLTKNRNVILDILKSAAISMIPRLRLLYYVWASMVVFSAFLIRTLVRPFFCHGPGQLSNRNESSLWAGTVGLPMRSDQILSQKLLPQICLKSEKLYTFEQSFRIHSSITKWKENGNTLLAFTCCYCRKIFGNKKIKSQVDGFFSLFKHGLVESCLSLCAKTIMYYSG